uniref:Uncharacterized protein n=1 Tax=Rhizophora mucronata TaxID=61149 RepID=A0A2P2NT77_RHIMU
MQSRTKSILIEKVTNMSYLNYLQY